MAFDVGQAVYGTNAKSYFMRIVGLAVICTLLLARVRRVRHRFRQVDGLPLSWASLREELEFHFLRPAFALRMLRNFIPFLSPTFRPWKFRDNAAHLARYRQEVVSDEWVLPQR